LGQNIDAILHNPHGTYGTENARRLLPNPQVTPEGSHPLIYMPIGTLAMDFVEAVSAVVIRAFAAPTKRVTVRARCTIALIPCAARARTCMQGDMQGKQRRTIPRTDAGVSTRELPEGNL